MNLSWFDRLLIKIAIAQRFARAGSIFGSEGDALASAFSSVNSSARRTSR